MVFTDCLDPWPGFERGPWDLHQPSKQEESGAETARRQSWHVTPSLEASGKSRFSNLCGEKDSATITYISLWSPISSNRPRELNLLFHWRQRPNGAYFTHFSYKPLNITATTDKHKQPRYVSLSWFCRTFTATGRLINRAKKGYYTQGRSVMKAKLLVHLPLSSTYKEYNLLMFPKSQIGRLLLRLIMSSNSKFQPVV